MAERPHPGFEAWVCLGCGKEWQVAADSGYPRLICDCGSTLYRLKKVHDEAERVRKDIDELKEAIGV